MNRFHKTLGVLHIAEIAPSLWFAEGALQLKTTYFKNVIAQLSVGELDDEGAGRHNSRDFVLANYSSESSCVYSLTFASVKKR